MAVGLGTLDALARKEGEAAVAPDAPLPTLFSSAADEAKRSESAGEQATANEEPETAETEKSTSRWSLRNLFRRASN